jgi:hypothetical protein
VVYLDPSIDKNMVPYSLLQDVQKIIRLATKGSPLKLTSQLHTLYDLYINHSVYSIVESLKTKICSSLGKKNIKNADFWIDFIETSPSMLTNKRS